MIVEILDGNILINLYKKLTCPIIYNKNNSIWNKT